MTTVFKYADENNNTIIKLIDGVCDGVYVSKEMAYASMYKAYGAAIDAGEVLPYKTAAEKIEEKLEEKKVREYLWRKIERSWVDEEILKLTDGYATANTDLELRTYRNALRDYSSDPIFPNGTRPSRP